MPNLAFEWIKSSYSGQNGECIEVRRSASAVDVRDSTAPQDGVVAVSEGAWADFVGAVKRGEFPLI